MREMNWFSPVQIRELDPGEAPDKKNPGTPVDNVPAPMIVHSAVRTRLERCNTCECTCGFTSTYFYFHGKERGMTAESDAVKTVADLMAIAARTAPKAVGIDSIGIEVLMGKEITKFTMKSGQKVKNRQNNQ